jgi:transcriptional regulator with XRE-family HTH domain
MHPFAFTAPGDGAPDTVGRPSGPAAPTTAPAQAGTQDFSARIGLLIERAGSVSTLARCCGVTERTVRNWRSGRGDLSRERCLALARALRISPLWLISGEGVMTDAPAGQPLPPATAAERRTDLDSERLAAALQVLQSYIVLAGGSLSLAQRAEAAVELYGLLARQGPGDIGRLIAFHKTLAAYLRSNRQALIA